MFVLFTSWWQPLEAGHGSHCSTGDWTWKAPGCCGNTGCKQIETWLGVAATIRYGVQRSDLQSKHLLFLRKTQVVPARFCFQCSYTQSSASSGWFAGHDATFSSWDQTSLNPGFYANPRLEEARAWNKRKSPWSRLLIKATAFSRWAAPPTDGLRAGQRLRRLMTVRHGVCLSPASITGCCPSPRTG